MQYLISQEDIDKLTTVIAPIPTQYGYNITRVLGDIANEKRVKEGTEDAKDTRQDSE